MFLGTGKVKSLSPIPALQSRESAQKKAPGYLLLTNLAVTNNGPRNRRLALKMERKTIISNNQREEEEERNCPREPKSEQNAVLVLKSPKSAREKRRSRPSRQIAESNDSKERSLNPSLANSRNNLIFLWFMKLLLLFLLVFYINKLLLKLLSFA